MSKNKANGKWTHKTSYWNSENVSREAWAHMVEAEYFEGQRKAIEEYFPTALKVFKEIIKGL